jgi:hypothetical protein
VYLNDLDHVIKEELNCRGYIRYVDDLLLFADDKSTLHQWHERLSTEFVNLRLKLHENRAFPRPTISGIPFLGFQIFPTHKRLKHRNVVHAFRRTKDLAKRYQSGEIDYKRVRAGMLGWLAHACFGDTFAIRSALCDKFVFRKQLPRD